MHSAALYLTSNDVHAILTPPSLCLQDSWWYPGNTIGHPKPGLGFPGSGHRTASFLEQGSVAIFFGVALQPKRKLSFLLEKILMTRL